MKEKLEKILEKVGSKLGIEAKSATLEYPENPEHGDFSTNLALIGAKKLGQKPRDLAEKIVAEIESEKFDFIKSISIAGAGFINFSVKDEFFIRSVLELSTKPSADQGLLPAQKITRKVMVEYTDPNPFKVFHIGHLMSNAIGESISRLLEVDGTKVIRANWQGDVGPHVAKAIWAALQPKVDDASDWRKKCDPADRASFWGEAYAFGSEAYDGSEAAKKEINEINKKIYEKSDKQINDLYEQGRRESLEAFEEMYKRLGTKFDNYFFEGREGRYGEAIVRENLEKGIFEQSEGAIIFPGEKYGLHTRVFITSQGLPTYETKELGLNTEKFKIYPDLDKSIIVTANEQNDYFKVLLKVFSLVRPDIAEKTLHISHGLLRFSSGKMSSRKGNIISAQSLINEIKEMVKNKMIMRDLDPSEMDSIADEVAIAAIKYTILRQGIGSDVVFDSVKSISFEGDSGPYLQYSVVRARSVLERSVSAKATGSDSASAKGRQIIMPETAGELEKLLCRFADIVSRSSVEYAPQILANYLINLSGAFNSFYNREQIIDSMNPLSSYRLALTEAFALVMERGLWLLGIRVPKRM